MMDKLKIDGDSTERLQRALDMITSYGGIDGAHHKQWVLDQVVRILAGDQYEAWKEDFEYPQGHDADEDCMYEWDEGIAP